ncbi:hypothetical protein M1555_04815 [Patescibacteria group bacterium]|nr:hypothetical protein [Patescibacteria group bacterium]
MIASESPLWHYLSPQQQSLLRDGFHLLEDRKLHPTERLSDYSYLVFPFAKAYEGFLKQWLRDIRIITDRDYHSDHFRVGKVLSPNLERRLGPRSAFREIKERFGDDLALHVWQTWKEARNLVFHYFPHNYRALTYEQAEKLTTLITLTMEACVSLK